MQAKRSIVYYTDNVPKESFLKTVRTHLKKMGVPVVWVSQKPIDEEPNIVLDGLERGHRSMTLQILAGLRNTDADIIYFAEHDVLYHPSHFDFVPPDRCFYYNTNRWWLCAKTGTASYTETSGSLSQLVAYRELLDYHYTQRNYVYAQGLNLRKLARTEPGKSKSRHLTTFKAKTFRSEWPNVDIRHRHNFTKSNRFRPDRPDYIFADEIPGWGRTKGRYKEFIKELNNGGSRYDCSSGRHTIPEGNDVGHLHTGPRD